MIKLTTLANICRLYDVPFAVEFTHGASFAVIGGTIEEHKNEHGEPSQFLHALQSLGARPLIQRACVSHDLAHDMVFQLESLT